MKTVFLLLAEYETGIIPLDKIADRWFGLTTRKAAERAAAGALPVAAFRLGSQKSQWQIHATDLALWIDEQRAAAAERAAMPSPRTYR
jgi:hypothetical protein